MELWFRRAMAIFPEEYRDLFQEMFHALSPSLSGVLKPGIPQPARHSGSTSATTDPIRRRTRSR